MDSRIERLQRACQLQTDCDFESYISACRDLRGESDSHLLQAMLDCLDDALAGEVQYELIEACESFPDDVYVEVLLAGCADGYARSPYWFDLMFCSLLNTERLFDQIRAQVRLFPDARCRINSLVAAEEVAEEFCRAWRAAEDT